MHPFRMMAVGLGAAALLLVAGITLASAADAPAPPIATAGNERSSAAPPADDSLEDCTPVIGVDPGILDFGNVETGQVLDLDLTISNDESGVGCALTIDGISLPVNPGSVFELLNLPSFPHEVIVGTPLTIQVRFAPAVAGLRQGQVLIESDATNEPEKTVTLQGNGVVQPTESITVTVPNGGEEYAPDQMPDATWETTGTVPLVDIDLSTDGGGTWVPLGQDITNTGTFPWLVPNTPTAQGLIRVQDADDGIPSDVSDAAFFINGVEVTRPNGGENFVIGTSEQIAWGSFGTGIANVRIELSTDNGTTWTDIIASTTNSGTYDWTVAGDETNEALVRISDAANAAANDISDGVFNIVPEGQNQAPTCDAGGPYTGTAEQPVSFDGSNSTDPDGTIVRYDWDFGDGSTAPDGGPTPTHTYTSEGTFTVGLTVTDDDDDFSSCQSEAVISSGGGEFPVCNADGPYTGEPDEAVSFDGTGSTDPDGTIVSYEWDFGDGGSGTGPTPTHTYTTEGTFTVGLVVTDDDDQSSNCSTTATITAVPNELPVCDADGPYAGSEGSPINFDGRDSFDPDGTIASYAWDFGDGGTGTGPTPSHTYTAAGTYTVELTVTDDDNASTDCSTSADVVVPGEEVNVAVPPKVFGSRNDDIRVPIFVENDLTGLGVLSTEFSITYDPQVLYVENVNLAGTIGEGGTVEWHVHTIERHEEIVRVSIAWVTPLEDCEEMAYVVFQATNNTEDRSPLDLEILFNEGDPVAIAHDGEFIKHILGDVNCSGNVSPLDASLTLQIAVGRVHIPDQRYPCLSLDVADVTGNGAVSGFDASYIQRFAIGAIENFPVEDLLECERFLAGGKTSSFIASEAEPVTPHAVALSSSAAGADGAFEVTVGIDDLAQVFGGDFEIAFDPSALRVVEVTPLAAGGGVIAESHVEGGAVRLAVALAEAASGPADLARVRFAHLDPGTATASRIDLSRAELNEGGIPVSTFGVMTPLPSAATVVDSLEVVVPLRAFGARLADVEIPVFVRDDVTGLGVYSADIVIGYDPDALEGRGVDLDDTIGSGGIASYNVVHIGEHRDEMRVSIAWTTPIEGCGTFAKVLFQATLESTAPDPRTSPLDLEVVFNEGDPPVKTESGTFIRAMLGDVNGSSNLSPIDASLILQHLAGRFSIPNERWPNFVLVVADVSGNGEIRAFDAALILQKILGIIEFFPGENIGLECNTGGFGRSMPVSPIQPRELALSWLSEAGGVAEAVLELSDGSGVLGVEASLVFDPSVLRLIEVIDSGAGEESLLETRITDGRLELAAARARAVDGKAEIVRVRFERVAEGETEVRIEAPILNEGTVPVVTRTASLGSPGAPATALWQNRPNPFNPATDIGFVIGAPSLVDLTVFDLAGRRVRTLVREHLSAGEHVAHWDGRDDAGQLVAAGVYLYTLDAGGSRMTRKMLLIK